MSGESESSRMRRFRRRPEPTESAWDDARTSHADRRRLAEVQEAKRRRRGDGHIPLEAASGDVPGAAENVTVESSTPARPEPATVHVTQAKDASDRVHVDPSLALAPVEQSTRSKDTAHLSILVVCTGNVCRSPYFERVLGHALRDLPVSVTGAGTGALLIDRMASGSADLLRHRGIDAERFRPRQLTADMVEDADLVLTATREHRHVVVEEAPSQGAKVFALIDFADACSALLAGDTPPRGEGLEAFRAFLARTRAGALERRSTRSEEDAAILDPFRQGPEMFARMADQSDPALDVVARTVRAFLA